MSIITLLLLIAKNIVAPIFVFTRFRRDPFILIFGLCGVFTMNTTMMAVIRDLGGMDWLKGIGREPWFPYQYDIAYWMGFASSIALVAFLLRLSSIKNYKKDTYLSGDNQQ